MKNLRIAGVDLGGKQSGATALCVLDSGAATVLRAAKGKDGHAWLHEEIVARHITHIFIDAPLSLPGLYRGLKGFNDFHFRVADRQLRAMSPLFLGGLTASAMEMAAAWRERGITTVEVYPSALVRQLGLQPYYTPKHQKAPALPFIKKLRAHPEVRRYFSGIKWNLPDAFSSHEADAILCLLSGLRFLRGEALSYGQETEGLIWV